MRIAKVCGWPELLWRAQEEGSHSMKEVYESWMSMRAFAVKRTHGNSSGVRRAAAHQRKQDTGRWGHYD